MYYIESKSTNPYFNLALEQYVFDEIAGDEGAFMLWQNDNAVIIGKHQNTYEEINAEYVKEHGIRVARRLSGGGAVYHDLGNLNYTFIAKDNTSTFTKTDIFSDEKNIAQSTASGIVNKAPGNTAENSATQNPTNRIVNNISEEIKSPQLNFALFCAPVANALKSMGVNADISGRNDMTIDRKKFSGSAQYVKNGRVMHHGTLMFDSDLDAVSKALNVKNDKLESKGIKSVRSRVTNIKPYINDRHLTVYDFKEILLSHMRNVFDLKDYTLTLIDTDKISELEKNIYSTYEWNYGASPKCTVKKERRIDGVGSVQLHMDVQKGKIVSLKFYGDFFSLEEPDILSRKLQGASLNEAALNDVLFDFDVERCIAGLKKEELIDIILL